jgi:hypothetical protein
MVEFQFGKLRWSSPRDCEDAFGMKDTARR